MGSNSRGLASRVDSEAVRRRTVYQSSLRPKKLPMHPPRFAQPTDRLNSKPVPAALRSTAPRPTPCSPSPVTRYYQLAGWTDRATFAWHRSVSLVALRSTQGGRQPAAVNCFSISSINEFVSPAFRRSAKSSRMMVSQDFSSCTFLVPRYWR